MQTNIMITANTGSMLASDAMRIINTPHVLPIAAHGAPVEQQNAAEEQGGMGVAIPGATAPVRAPLALTGLHELDAHAWATGQNVLGKFIAGVGVGGMASSVVDEPCSPPRRKHRL